MNRLEPTPALAWLSRLIEAGSPPGEGPQKVAAVGRRDLPPGAAAFLAEIGFGLVRSGGGRLYVASGNAPGADQAYAAGVNDLAPNHLVLYLPWKGFETAAIRPGNRVRLPPYAFPLVEAARRIHPRGKDLARGPLALHVRNMAIVQDAAFGVAWPRTTSVGGPRGWTGGTATGMRKMMEDGVPLLDLSDPAVRQAAAEILGISAPDTPR